MSGLAIARTTTGIKYRHIEIFQGGKYTNGEKIQVAEFRHAPLTMKQVDQRQGAMRVFSFFQDIDLKGFPDKDDLLAGIRVLGHIDASFPESSLALVKSFLAIADYILKDHGDGVSLRDIAGRSGIKYPTMMRHLEILSDGSRGQPGLKYIRRDGGGRGRGGLEVSMTEEGMAVLMGIVSAIRNRA